MIKLVCIRCGRHDEVPAGSHQYLSDAPCVTCGSLMLETEERVALWIIEHPWKSLAIVVASLVFFAAGLTGILP